MCDSRQLIEIRRKQMEDIANNLIQQYIPEIPFINVQLDDWDYTMDVAMWPESRIIKITQSALMLPVVEEVIGAIGHELGHLVDYCKSETKIRLCINSTKQQCHQREFLADELAITLFKINPIMLINYLRKAASNLRQDFFQEWNTHPSYYDRIQRLQKYL